MVSYTLTDTRTTSNEKGAIVKPTGQITKILAVLMAALGLALSMPSLASAAFVRPFLRQITGTCPSPGVCAATEVIPFEGPGGVALDGKDDLWVWGSNNGGKEAPPFQLDEFSPAYSAIEPNTLLETLAIEGKNPPENQYHESEGLTPPDSLAIDNSTGSFYTAGKNTLGSYSPYVEVFDSAGAFVKRIGPVSSGAHVAVDDSTEPSAGSVYVTPGSAGVIEKFNAAGEKEPFEGCGTECSGYLSTNEITGAPGSSFLRSAGNVAVGSHGDLYVTVQEYPHFDEVAILEYAPSGKFIRVFTGQQTPGLDGSHFDGFGGSPVGVAIDPTDGDVLVNISGNGQTGLEGKAAVDEFDSTGHFLGQIIETSPGNRLRSVNGTTETTEMTVDSRGDLYVADSTEHAVDVYSEGHFVPGVWLGEATGRAATKAVLNGSVNPEADVNPEHAGLAECYFEYVSEKAFDEAEARKEEGFADSTKAACVPAAASIEANETYQPVHADIAEHISPGVTYRYRLLATTGGAHGGTQETAALAFTTPHAPEVLSSSAGNLSSAFADLEATIDPLGAETAYHFEYLPAAEFEANGDSFLGPDLPTSAPIPDGAIGAGGPTGRSAESVVQQIGGLAPGTAYDFRVVATNECEAIEHPGKQCVVPGEAQVFATLPAVEPGLPDGRAYELVTPPDKSGAADMFALPETNGEFFNHDVGVVSESGDQFLLQTFSGFGPFPFSGQGAYVFSRHSSRNDPERAEWSYTSLASPSLGVQVLDGAGAGVLFDPADFSEVGFADSAGSAGSVEGSRLTSLLGPPGGPYTVLHADSPAHSASITGAGEIKDEENTHLAGSSRDLSHVVVESRNHTLAPGDESQDSGSNALYAYSGGEPQLVNVKNNGTLISDCGAVLGEGGGGGGSTHNAVSGNGARVFFTAPDPGAVNDGPGCWNGVTTNAPQLYVRSGAGTVEVSQPEKGVLEEGHPPIQHRALYVGAAEDGSRVFFVTETELTKNDEGIHDPELYEYDAETDELSRVSAGEAGEPGDTAGADVKTVPAVSAEGTAVYFTAFGALAKDSKSYTRGEELVNLYRYDTSAKTTTYVATVSTADYTTAGDFATADDPSANWYTTPDGRYLLFATSRELTDYHTAGPCATLPDNGGNGNGHCDELYRYDSATGELVCVSCNPGGLPPVSHAEFGRSAYVSPAAGPVRAMSDNGSYAFFDTADALVSTDSNKTLDVYEWEAQGTGGCELQRGCVDLISSGKDAYPSYFLGASSDGSNVFFGTHGRLVPADADSSGDVYDARICTAEEPCIKPPVGETAQCEGDACHTPPPAPIDATPASLTFAGPGDLVSELSSVPPAKATTKKTVPCARGFVKKKNRCVRIKKKKTGKPVHAKRSSHSKGSK